MDNPPKHIFRQPLPDFGSFQLNQDGQPLTAAQTRVFNECCRELQHGNCRFVYRGDRKSAVGQRFGIDPAQIPEQFNERLFIIGPKGRHFWQELSEQAAGRTPDFAIDDDSDAFFQQIFDMLGELLTVRRFTPGVQKAIDRFAKGEPDCAQFFSFRKNKKALVKAIKDLTYQQRIKVRDYYLTLLHHMGASEYYPVSFLLSATLSWEVAWKFSAEERLAGDEIIFIGWVPWGTDTILHTFRFGGWGRPDLLDQIGLPRYHRSFFPRQREVTLKGGLLPHYTLGYYYNRHGQPTFEINPWLFKISEQQWIKNGLPVDQRDFYGQLSQTEYRRGYMVLSQNNEFRELPWPLTSVE